MDENKEVNTTNPKREKVRVIPLSAIDDAPDHPFRVRDDEEMAELVESISTFGVINPVIVRKGEGERYELISGHRRKYACAKLGIETLPVIVRDLTREEAIIFMVDSNLQREHILPSERAKAYKMKMEALKRVPGKRYDENGAPLVPLSDGMKTRDIVGAENGESREQVRRYIRLNNLIYEGSFTDRKTEVKFTWGLVAELIEALAKDKNYLDEPKEDKQLSLLDMEENAVESAYEPPSKVEKPLAFSQATIDDFLRVGGCTKNSPERIYGYYRRASDKEENICFLKNEYETDNVGLIIDGRKMAASWNEDGMIIAEGTKVDGAWKSITLTWDEIEKRTRELIELGQYLPQHQAEQADEIFEKFVADRLASLYHGGSFANIPEEHLSVSGFMSYPKYVEAFQDILQDPVKAAALYYCISNKTKVEYNFLPYNLKALEFQGLFLL